MNKTMSKRYKITLAIFVFVTITAGLFGYLLDQVLTEQPEGSSLGMGLWLVLPLLTGVVLGIINKDLKQIGVKPNFKHNLKWYSASVFVFPCVMLINIIVAKITGGLTVGEIELSALFVLMLSSFSGSFIKNIFEEFAWRGSLFTYLEKAGMNDWLLYLFNGLIWGMWHITYYMFFLPDEYFTQISRPMMVVVGIAVMIFWSPMFVELRRLTNSVWPCVIAHSMEDAVPTMLFVTAGVLQIKQEYFVMLDSTRGILPTVLVFLIGVGLRRIRIKQEQAVVCDK
ncbi:MAG: type II CAAX endopeptidase family protein [Acutalibacteraceae bacterium]|nr:type II CAAX endopeptidase family protein [Acutalibacteraceae bacterium]